MEEAFAFNLEIDSITGKLFSGKVKSLRVTGSEGEMGIRFGHAPLLTTIKSGQARYIGVDDDDEHFIALKGGILEVQPDAVYILADAAIHGEEIDEARAKAAVEEAREAMTRHAGGDKDYASALSQLADAMAQLKAVELTRNRRH